MISVNANEGRSRLRNIRQICVRKKLCHEPQLRRLECGHSGLFSSKHHSKEGTPICYSIWLNFDLGARSHQCVLMIFALVGKVHLLGIL